MLFSFGFVLVFLTGAEASEASWKALGSKGLFKGYPAVFQNPPPNPPAYMVDNTDNLSGQAPINGKYNGPVWAYSGSFDKYMKRLRSGNITGKPVDTTKFPLLQNLSSSSDDSIKPRQGETYWLPSLAAEGKQPVAPTNGYKFYRDVTDYGADNTGQKDATEAINAAIQDGDRCGMECGNSFSQGAMIYFPAGTYEVCTPIIQLYYTQFIGDPIDRPIIKGCGEFTGIALLDTDPYIPNEAQPDARGSTDENGQSLAPTGVHWQVSQACSLQNLHFKMPTASDSNKPTHVGIFMENGSGGFVSDLTFEGGAIGWRAGSQQYTARGLKSKNCITAIQMIWDWGFNWQDIEIYGGSIGLNITSKGGLLAQGIGSISIIDSTIKNVPVGILTRESSVDAPNIVLDNVEFSGVSIPVQADGGKALLSGSQKVDLWATGRRYTKGKGGSESGMVTDRVPKPKELLDSNAKLFTKSRPQYENEGVDSFLVATQNGCDNGGGGDQTNAINPFLKKALDQGKIA
ncbi:pectate lyase superfamily domain-containing protein [Trichoderma evansii]